MRKKLPLILCLFWVVFHYAQTITTNDFAFETYLEGLPEAGANTPNDNQVNFSNILGVTAISCSNCGFTDLTGLENFTNLTTLEVQNNNGLTSISEAFGLQNLQIIRTFNSQVAGVLDFSAMPNLQVLGLDNCNIDGLIFDPDNTVLNILDIRNNNLTQLVLPQGANLQQLIVTENNLQCGLNISSFVDTLNHFAACDNPNLDFVYVAPGDLATVQGNPGAGCPQGGTANNNINGFSISNNTSFQSTTLANYVTGLDPSFEQILIDNGYDSEGGPTDGQILRCDAENVVQLNLTRFEQVNSNNGFNSYDNIYVTTESNQAGGITDLTGLDAFVNIKVLYIQGNQGGGIQNSFSTLDLTANDQLEQIFAFWNPNLTSVNFNGLTELKNIGLNVCDLSTLDLSNNVGTNAAFLDVNVGQNQLTSVNFGTISNITDLQLLDNQLTEINISNFDTLLISDPDPADGGPDPAFRATGNAGLTCILVSDRTNAINQTAIDTGGTEGNNWQIPNGDGNPDTSLFKTGSCSTSPNDFVISIQTDNTGTSGNTQFEIPTTGGGYNYNVNWGDGNTDTAVNGNITHTYAAAGTYTVTISDNSGGGTGFPRIFFNGGGDAQKLLDIIQWGTGTWTSMANAFDGCSNLGTITATDAPNLGSVTDLTRMFFNANQFNGDISGWDVSTITTMSQMFTSANLFNANIGGWNTANVQDMSFMFFNASVFNGNIGSWNVSQVTNMELMFDGADGFNQDIGGWNTGNVTNLRRMFQGNDAFNQDISNWNTANVTNFNSMFFGATAFNQSLGNLDISQATDMADMLDGSALSVANYDSTLIGWAAQTLQNGIDLGAAGLFYCDGETARQSIIDNFTWTFTDDARQVGCNNATPDDFVITVQTDNPGSSGNTEFEIPTTGGGYNYNVNWGDGNTDTAVNGNITHTYAAAGTYTIIISDNSGAGTGFPRIYFNNERDRQKLVSIDQWGAGIWSSMAQAFWGCTNVTYNATDLPDLSNVTSLEQMFNLAEVFNGDLSGWDTSSVTNMRAVFAGALIFNQPIGSWNTSNVTNMAQLFFNAEQFDAAIGNWDVSQVTDMSLMFSGADAFNQDISLWNTSNVTTMEQMFIDADLFNQDITGWNTGSVNDMSQMFRGALAFNQNISTWNTANVTNMFAMFLGASVFDQNLGGWNIGQVVNMAEMFNDNTSTGSFSITNYDATLIGWAAQTVQNGVSLGANNISYCDGNLARTTLICENNWTISGDVLDCSVTGCTPVRFADDDLKAFLINDANNANFLDQNGLPVDLDPTGSGEVCVEQAALVRTLILNTTPVPLTSLMGSCIDPNNPISAAASPDATNPNDPTNGLIAFSNLTELDISNNSFENGLQVPNVSLERLIADNCIQGNVGATWTADVNDTNFFLTNVTYFQFQDNFTLVPAFDVNFNGLNNVTEAVLSGTNLSGLEITASIWNGLELLTYENTNSLVSIAGLQNAINLRELRINGSKYTGDLNLSGLGALQVIQADDNNITGIDISSSSGIQSISAVRNQVLTSVNLPTGGGSITGLFLDDNDITELDISGVDSGLTGGGVVFSILNNDNLNCVKVSSTQDAIDRTNGSNYAIPNGNTSIFTEQDCTCTAVTIPDTVLKNFLLNNTFEDVNGDFISIGLNGEVCQELAETIVRLDINGIGVANLTGLEVFTSLQYFDAFTNPSLTSLAPIEGLAQMIELRAFDSAVDGILDLTAMPNLTIVGMDNNGIDGILFNSGNTALQILDIKNNELTQLQLPTAPSLNRLIIANNQLMGNLDIRAFSAGLDDFWACGNQFDCIQVNQTDLDNLASRLSASTCVSPPAANNLVDDWLVDDNNLFSVDCNVNFVATILATDDSAAEPNDNGEFTVSLSQTNNTGGPITIAFTINGNADNGVDYGTVNTTIDILDNEISALIPINVIDDFIDEVDEDVMITLENGTGYTLGTEFSATVTIADNDTAGITVDPTSGLLTSENGTSDTFTVVLDSEPISDVVLLLSLQAATADEAQLDLTTLTFTPANWNIPQTVTVTGEDDIEADGNQNIQIDIVVDDPNSDDAYNGLTASVLGVNQDNDSPGITVDPSSGLQTSEDGTTDSFTVVLNNQPASNVVLDISSTVPVEATVSPEQVTFTPQNWDTPQQITLTGVEDQGEVDGDQNYIILIDVNDALSDDAYDNVNTVSIAGTNADNDSDNNNGPDLTNTAFEVQIKSDACPNSNPPTGSIQVSTDSGRTFDVSFDDVASGTLTSDTSWVQGSLAPGTYDVCLTLSEFPNWQRCFRVEIRGLEVVNLNGLTTLTAREVVDLNVSGSEKYTVNVNGEILTFNSVNGTGESILQVPLKSGVNKLLITGESQCQGIIEQEIVLGQTLVFPNPVTEFITVIGVPIEGELEYALVDYSGRIVQQGKVMVDNNKLERDIGAVASGNYILLLRTPEWEKEFKIIKQ